MHQLSVDENDVRKSVERLFLLEFEVRSGDEENRIKRVARATSIDSAEEKARDYMSCFWGDYTKANPNDKDQYLRTDGGETITLKLTMEVTVEQLIDELDIE
jgi:hypothetical protein